MALSVQLRLLAPILPFVTEEAWSWWQEGSVHRAAWPTTDECAAGDADPQQLTVVGVALGALRGAKSQAKVSQRTEVSRAVITGPAASLDLLRGAEGDLRAAGRVSALELSVDGDDLAVRDVDLVPAETPA